jgi:hypothetical protein
MNPIAYHSGADFSVFTGVAAGGIVYAVLGWKGVRRQADGQDEVLAGTENPGAT